MQRACRNWRNKVYSDKTWAKFFAHFLQAERDNAVVATPSTHVMANQAIVEMRELMAHLTTTQATRDAEQSATITDL